jgi:hypothetical protein
MLGVTEQNAKSLVNLATTGFLDFAHLPELYILENTTFQELDLLPSSGEGMQIRTLSGPLEIANLILFPHLRIDIGPVSETLCFLVFRIADD